MGADPVLQAFDAYNRVAAAIGLPIALSLTRTRRAKIAARLGEVMQIAGIEQAPLETWALALGRLKESSFCQGRNARGWKADLDFLTQPTSYWRLIEGRYSDEDKRPYAPPPPSPSGPRPWEERSKDISRLKHEFLTAFLRNDLARMAREEGWYDRLKEYVEREAHTQAQRVAKAGGQIDVLIPENILAIWRKP